MTDPPRQHQSGQASSSAKSGFCFDFEASTGAPTYKIMQNPFLPAVEKSIGCSACIYNGSLGNYIAAADDNINNHEDNNNNEEEIDADVHDDISNYRCLEHHGQGDEDEDLLLISEISSDSDLDDSRCSSTSSIVTHAASESCTVKSDMDAESLENQWTDDKHKSYLTFMETNFVNKLYHREYCALDVCGQAPCQHHSPATESGAKLPEFKSWQNGDWEWRSMPKYLIPACKPLALLRNPWINHFRHISGSRVGNAHVFADTEENEEVNSPLSTNANVQSHRVLEQGASTERLDVQGNGTNAKRSDIGRQVDCNETAHFKKTTRKRSLQQDSDERRSFTRQKNNSVQLDGFGENDI